MNVFCSCSNTFNNIRKGKYACFMKMFIQHFKSCRKIKGSKNIPSPQMGSKDGDVCFWLRRWALCICHVFGLQMISETPCTSMVTHFMSTVRADKFCPIDRTIWQCFESEFAVDKSFLHLLSLSLFSLLCFSWMPILLLLLLIPFLILLPPSGSRLQVSMMAANQTMRVPFFLMPTVNRTLKKLTALRGCCVNARLTH